MDITPLSGSLVAGGEARGGALPYYSRGEGRNPNTPSMGCGQSNHVGILHSFGTSAELPEIGLTVHRTS